MSQNDTHGVDSASLNVGTIGFDVQLREASPHHRMLLSGWRAQLFISVPAKGLLNDNTVLTQPTPEDVTYIHLGLAQHQITIANGPLTESLHSGSVAKRY